MSSLQLADIYPATGLLETVRFGGDLGHNIENSSLNLVAQARMAGVWLKIYMLSWLLLSWSEEFGGFHSDRGVEGAVVSACCDN